MKPIRFVMIFLILGVVFVGAYFCLYGGIVQFINGITTSPVSSGDIAWGIVRVLLTVPCIWVVSVLFCILIVSFKGIH